MYGSYRGYYNEHQIHSSYEYVLCKILEIQNKKFKTQCITYDLGASQYTPDFVIYNKFGDIEEIIEVRASRFRIEERKKDILCVKDLFGVNILLYTENDLIELCKETNLSFEDICKEWIDSLNSSLNDCRGELNPMFGKKQSFTTKQIMSNKARLRMADPNYKEKTTKNMIKFNRENNFYFMRKPRSERTLLKCKNCGELFEVTISSASKRVFCSLECASLSTIKIAAAQKSENYQNRSKDILDIVLRWGLENKEKVNQIKMNSITTSIKDLLSEIEKKTGVKDMRTITNAVFKTSSRKQFVTELQKYINNNNPSHD